MLTSHAVNFHGFPITLQKLSHCQTPSPPWHDWSTLRNRTLRKTSDSGRQRCLSFAVSSPPPRPSPFYSWLLLSLCPDFPLPSPPARAPYACPHSSQTLPAKKVPTANQPLPISMEELQELEHTQPAQVNVNLARHKTISEVTPLPSWHPEHTWESSQLPAVPPPGKRHICPPHGPPLVPAWPSCNATATTPLQDVLSPARVTWTGLTQSPTPTLLKINFLL